MVKKIRIRDLARNCWLEETETSLHCFTNYHLNFDGSVVAVEGAISEPGQVSYAKLDWLSFGPTKVTKAAERFVVQQFTGVQDADKKDIYEGDIVFVGGRNREIVWRGAGFYCTWSEYALDTCWFVGDRPRVIGNKFDNPELCVK